MLDNGVFRFMVIFRSAHNTILLTLYRLYTVETPNNLYPDRQPGILGHTGGKHRRQRRMEWTCILSFGEFVSFYVDFSNFEYSKGLRNT